MNLPLNFLLLFLRLRSISEQNKRAIPLPVVKEYLDKAGIKRAGFHTLKHTFATHPVATDTDLRTVQEALGHKDLKTTSIIHIQLAPEVMKKELQEHAL